MSFFVMNYGTFKYIVMITSPVQQSDMFNLTHFSELKFNLLV